MMRARTATLSRREFVGAAAMAAGFARFGSAQPIRVRQRHDSGRHPLAPHRQRERPDRAYSGSRL